MDIRIVKRLRTADVRAVRSMAQTVSKPLTAAAAVDRTSGTDTEEQAGAASLPASLAGLPEVRK